MRRIRRIRRKVSLIVLLGPPDPDLDTPEATRLLGRAGSGGQRGRICPGRWPRWFAQRRGRRSNPVRVPLWVCPLGGVPSVVLAADRIAVSPP